MRSAVEHEKGLGEKLDPEEKRSVMSAVQEGREWLETHSDAEVDEIQEKMREVEVICAPIVSKYSSEHSGASRQEEEKDGEAHDEL